ncbi:MAG: hypothetical protein RL701_1872 [Pseudomonadota bacterium]
MSARASTVFAGVASALMFACNGAIKPEAPPYNPGGTAAVGGAHAAGSGGAGASAGTVAPAAPVDCDTAQFAPRRIWRLTATQYDNTLKDLLGIDSQYGAGFPADDVGVGFGNAADALLMTPLLADKVASAAQDCATQADLSRIASCAASSRDDTCLREFITKLGERAFRRPLNAAEIARYLNLAQQPGAFDTGARLAIMAMLQSPNFLYRFELGQASATAGVYELDDYEVASELSYLLWQTMPDAALFEAASKHKLRDKAELRAQVTRMLQADRAKPVVRRFVFDWLGLANIATVPKDTTRYPELTTEIRTALTSETERFVDAVMFGASVDSNGSIAALLNAKPSAPEASLATFYGADASIDRRGILTLGGVLLTHSRSNDSSPIHRGKLVREHLLCQPLPPPPPGLVLQPPGLDPTKTARERYAAHSANGYCQSCHKLMDPIGLAFEHFDGIGRYRATDNGLAIDPSGAVVPNDVTPYPATDADGAFSGTDGLIDKLVQSADVQRCYAIEWFRFGYGEGKTERDAPGYPSCQAKRFQAAIARTSGSLSEIIDTLTQSDWFLTRTGPDPSTVPVITEPDPAPVPTDAGVPTTMQPMAADGITMERTVDNDWGAGYCYTYQLRNTTAAPVTWSVPLEVRGKMNNHWQCKVTGESGQVMFTGEDYNQTIPPNGMAEFGFCAVVN